MNRFAPGLLVALLLAGCANNKYCERSERTYERSKESAPLKAPEGLSVPAPDPNQAIPKATGPQVPFASEQDDPKKKGGKRSTCLDSPPDLPPEQGVAKPEAAP